MNWPSCRVEGRFSSILVPLAVSYLSTAVRATVWLALLTVKRLLPGPTGRPSSGHSLRSLKEGVQMTIALCSYAV